MPDSNVVEGRFTRPLTIEERVEGMHVELEELTAETKALFVQTARFERWERNQHRLLVQRLRRDLEAERRMTTFSDEDALRALRSIGVTEPVAARAVADAIFPGEPSVSGVIRVAQALARLADSGRVIRVRGRRPGRDANRWQVV